MSIFVEILLILSGFPYRGTDRWEGPILQGFAGNSSGGEWGVGSGEWGVRSGEWGVGSGEWAPSEDPDGFSLLPSPFSLLPNREVLWEGP